MSKSIDETGRRPSPQPKVRTLAPRPAPAPARRVAQVRRKRRG
jgi:hypothetical protein